jgi:pyruvate formate lyase activating enzyme
MTVAEVMAIVLRDRGYYADSGGGLTLSGGEPLHQPAFSQAILAAAKVADLHTAVETSGFASWDALNALRPLTDLFLFDIKETDPTRHLAVTGVPMAPIHENLRRLAANGAEIVLRLPMVLGYNDRPDHIEAVGALARSLPTPPAVDLLPYHRLGKGKRLQLGDPDHELSFPPAPDQVQAWKAQFAAAGLEVRLPEER